MPNVTLVDAGPLIALFNPRDRDHAACRQFFQGFTGRLMTTWPVMTESAYMLSQTISAPIALLKWAAKGATGGLDVRHLGLENVGSMIAYTQKYRDLPMDLADASLVALSIDTGVTEIVSLDSDFDVYRLPNGKALVNLLQV